MNIRDQATLSRLRHSVKKTAISQPIVPTKNQSPLSQIKLAQYDGFDGQSGQYKIGDNLVSNLLTIDAIPEGKQVLLLGENFGDY